MENGDIRKVKTWAGKGYVARELLQDRDVLERHMEALLRNQIDRMDHHPLDGTFTFQVVDVKDEMERWRIDPELWEWSERGMVLVMTSMRCYEGEVISVNQH